MRETDLYQPVKELLVRLGYTVSGEVKDCDIAASRKDELVIVELKVSANLKLLIQATDRQALADTVYVALPEPGRRDSHFRGVERLLRRLGLGLITVRFGPLGAAAELRFEPGSNDVPKKGKRRGAVTAELAGRSQHSNIGGSSGTRIMTAYRETAIFIACCLEQLGPSSTHDLRALGTGDRTTSILAKNYYGWFSRVDRGIYQLTQAGADALKQYPALKKQALGRLSQN